MMIFVVNSMEILKVIGAPRGPISFMKRLGLPHGYDSQFAMVKDPPFLSSVNLFFYGPFPMAMLNNQRV